MRLPFLRQLGKSRVGLVGAAQNDAIIERGATDSDARAAEEARPLDNVVELKRGLAHCLLKFTESILHGGGE